VKPDFVNLLTVFVVAVLAVFDYFNGFPHNAVMARVRSQSDCTVPRTDESLYLYLSTKYT
jgi:hypothetical protein